MAGDIAPFDDIHASADYRREVARGASRQDSQDSLGAQTMSDRHNISLNVNGADYSCEIDARMTLADCLREKLPT